MSQTNGSDVGGRRPTSVRTFVFGMIAGALVVIVLGGLIGLPLMLTHRTEFPLESTVGGLAVNVISSLNAGNATNPLTENDKTLADGEDLYITNCASCHGDTGDGKGDFVDQYYPPPTDLTSDRTQGKSDAQIRWLIQNGISFTAMAAYPEFNDQQLWSMVIYIRSLKK